MKPCCSQREALLLGTVLLLALCLRLGSAVWWNSQHPDFAFGDSDSYWVLAEKIAHGKPYLYGDAAVFRTPGYPAVLAPLYWLSDNPPILWARFLGAVLGTVTVLLLYLWIRKAVDSRTAIVAAALATVYPGAIAMSTFVLSEAIFCPLMLLHLCIWQSACQPELTLSKAASLAAIASVIAAVAILCRPSWLLLPAFGLVAGLPFQKQKTRWLLVTGIMLLAIAVTMTPWWVRNYRLAGRFIPTTLQVGASMYDGLHAGADGSSEMSFVAAEKAALLQESEAAGKSPSPIEVELMLNDRLRSKAMAWAKEHPGKVVQLAGVKLVRIWNVWPNNAEFQSWKLRTVVALGYVPLLAFAVVGWWISRKDCVFVTLSLLPAVYFTLLHCVFVGSLRYRQPAMLVLIGLSAVGLLAAVNWIWKPSKSEETKLNTVS